MKIRHSGPESRSWIIRSNARGQNRGLYLDFRLAMLLHKKNVSKCDLCIRYVIRRGWQIPAMSLRRQGWA